MSDAIATVPVARRGSQPQDLNILTFVFYNQPNLRSSVGNGYRVATCGLPAESDVVSSKFLLQLRGEDRADGLASMDQPTILRSVRDRSQTERSDSEIDRNREYYFWYCRTIRVVTHRAAS
jgi:hypothetical protein